MERWKEGEVRVVTTGVCEMVRRENKSSEETD